MTGKRLFSRWHARKARYWVTRLASGNITEAEMDCFRAWLGKSPHHRAAFQYQRSIWQALDGVREEIRRPVQPVAATMAARLCPCWLHPLPMVAVVVLVLVALPLLPRLWLATQADHRSGVLPRTITLADGSVVSLDAGSAIAVDFSADERRVRLLQGRAWFEVEPEPERPFRVAALSGVTEDISTAFVIGVADGAVKTGVERGRVRVSADGRNGWIELEAGQQVRYLSGGTMQAVASVPVDALAAWRHGEILLDDVPLKVAIERIARYRDGPVWVVGNLDDRPRITGVFRIDDVDAALQALAQRSRLKVVTLPANGWVMRPE